jgi:hypothetical protein
MRGEGGIPVAACLIYFVILVLLALALVADFAKPSSGRSWRWLAAGAFMLLTGRLIGNLVRSQRWPVTELWQKVVITFPQLIGLAFFLVSLSFAIKTSRRRSRS